MHDNDTNIPDGVTTVITKTRMFKYIEKISHKKKTVNFQIKKKTDFFFQISAQNIDCGYPLEPPRRGGSNGHLQSMFLSRNKKKNAYPCKSHFYYIKVGFNGVKIKLYMHVFVMALGLSCK